MIAYGFAKSAAATLTSQGQEALTKVSAAVLDADDAQVAALLCSGDLKELDLDAVEEA